MFKHQLEGLQDICRVLALDLRGHGDSSDADHGYTVQRLAADVREVIIQLDLSDVAILGHSLGCSVIWAYWELFGSERLAEMILLDEPTMLTINPAWSEKQRLDMAALFTSEELWKYCNDLAGSDGVAMTDHFVRNLLSPQLTEDEQKWIVAENLKMPRDAAARLLYNTSSQDWAQVIPRITLPTLIIGARASRCPWQGQQWIHEQIAGSKLCIFEEDEGGHHFMFLENPEKFNAEIRTFLA